jgi:hypothetical protein
MDPMPRHKLFYKLRQHLDHVEFIALLEVLHEIGAIQRFQHQPDRGPRIDYIRGTQLLLSQGLGETVMEKFS